MTPLDAGTRLWWVRLPRAGARISSTLGLTLLDGHWVGAVRVLGAVATPLAVVVGVAIGGSHPGFDVLPTESLPLIALLVAVGVASGQLGLALLGGFAVGNLVLAGSTWSYEGASLSLAALARGDAGAYLLRVVLPLLIAYGVLAVVMVKLPLGTKAIVRALMPGDRSPLALRITLAVVTQVALTAALVYLWSLAAPVLLRPVWTWRGELPTVEAIRPLQEDAATLAWVAASVAGLRIGVQALLVTVRSLAARAGVIEHELCRALPAPPLYDRLPAVVRGVMTGIVTTLLLAGLFSAWAEAVVVFSTVTFFQLARTGVVPVPLGSWARLMDRIPVLVRFAAGLVIVFVVGQWFLPDRIRSAETFGPQLVFLLLGLAVFYLLVPTVPGHQGRDRAPVS